MNPKRKRIYVNLYGDVGEFRHISEVTVSIAKHPIGSFHNPYPSGTVGETPTGLPKRHIEIDSGSGKLTLANADGNMLLTLEPDPALNSNAMWLSMEQVGEIIRFFYEQTLGIDFAQIMIEAAKSGKKVRFE